MLGLKEMVTILGRDFWAYSKILGYLGHLHVTVSCRLQGKVVEVCFYDIVEARDTNIPHQLQNSQGRSDMGHAAALHACLQERQLCVEILARYQEDVKGNQDVCLQWLEALLCLLLLGTPSSSSANNSRVKPWAQSWTSSNTFKNTHPLPCTPPAAPITA